MKEVAAFLVKFIIFYMFPFLVYTLYIVYSYLCSSALD